MASDFGEVVAMILIRITSYSIKQIHNDDFLFEMSNWCAMSQLSFGSQDIDIAQYVQIGITDSSIPFVSYVNLFNRLRVWTFRRVYLMTCKAEKKLCKQRVLYYKNRRVRIIVIPFNHAIFAVCQSIVE